MRPINNWDLFSVVWKMKPIDCQESFSQIGEVKDLTIQIHFRLLGSWGQSTTRIHFTGLWNGSNRPLRFVDKVGWSLANQRFRSFWLEDGHSRSIEVLVEIFLSVEVGQGKSLMGWWLGVDRIKRSVFQSPTEIVNGWASADSTKNFESSKRSRQRPMGQWSGVYCRRGVWVI